MRRDETHVYFGPKGEQKPCVATVTSLDKGGMEVAIHVPTYSGGIKLTLSVHRDPEGNWRAFIPWVDEEMGDEPLHVQGCEVFGGILYLGSPEEESTPFTRQPEQRVGLISHLRHGHGFIAYEPGGEGWEEDVTGFTAALDSWKDEDLAHLHDSDHSDHPGGGGRNKHEHPTDEETP